MTEKLTRHRVNVHWRSGSFSGMRPVGDVIAGHEVLDGEGDWYRAEDVDRRIAELERQNEMLDFLLVKAGVLKPENVDD